jgi:tripartite-type tricarboxylate transporter receptor subunit TctC
MMVGAAAGRPIDVFTRIMAERMDPILEQRVLVENIGGRGTLCSQRVAKATAAEKDYPSVQACTLTALFLPNRTSPEVTAKLNAATVAAMGLGSREQFDNLAATLVAPERRAPAYLAGFVKSEWDNWGDAVRAGGAIPK